MTAAPTRGRSALAPELPFAFVQWTTMAGAVLVLVWSIPGLIANPDFATGDAATAERVLGVDMNGWHAVSGFLIAVPALVASLRRSWAAAVSAASAAGLLATAGWALLDDHPAGGLFYFPNGEADALLHVATASVFLAGVVQFLVVGRERG
jgi:hypothetical protein